MRNIVFSVIAALAITGAAPAFAADMPARAPAVAPAPPPSPWDISFGGVIMSDYVFRGISQSNNAFSGGAYIEPSYETAIGTFYVGIGALAISWPSGFNYGFTDPSAEVDFYGGWRNSWGPFSLDFGLIYYFYPGETFNGFTSDSDFYEVYGKAAYDFGYGFSLGANVYYTPDLLNYSETFSTLGISNKPGAVYFSGSAAWELPWKFYEISTTISGEYGYWDIEKAGFILAGATANPSYSYWNVGLAFAYKGITVDVRYHGTDQSPQDCANFLLVGVPNDSNNWCGDRVVAAIKFDTSLSALR